MKWHPDVAGLACVDCGARRDDHEWHCACCGTETREVSRCNCGAMHLPVAACECKALLGLYCPAGKRTITGQESKEIEEALAHLQILNPELVNHLAWERAEAERLRSRA